MRQFKLKILSSILLWCCILCCTYKVLLTFKSVDEIVKCGQTDESYEAVLVPVLLLFTMLYKVVLNFESVGETLKCDLSNESY